MRQIAVLLLSLTALIGCTQDPWVPVMTNKLDSMIRRIRRLLFLGVILGLEARYLFLKLRMQAHLFLQEPGLQLFFLLSEPRTQACHVAFALSLNFLVATLGILQ